MKNRFHNFIILLGLILLGFLVDFMISRYNNKNINNFSIYIEKFNKDSLLNKTNINQILFNGKKESFFLSKKIRDVSIFKIEKKIQSHPFIKKAEAFFDPTRNLNVKVWLHVPIARIKDENKEYYLSKMGELINLSNENVLEVILIKGTFAKKELHILKEIIEFINKDSFLKSQVIGIKKIINKELELILYLKNHLVILGNVDNFKEKIINLKTFYKQYLNKINFDDYKIINLQYKNQIVATKRKNNELRENIHRP